MKRILSAVLSLCLLLSIFGAAQAAETQISRADVTVILKTLGIMEGYSNGDFGYADALTRAQFAKISVMSSSYRDAVADVSRTSPFSDVKNTHWAASYVAVAAKNGLMKGYAKGDFRPERALLYEEAITVCLRLLGYSDQDLSAGYPHGQLAMAKSIGLTDNVGGMSGKSLTREGTARLIYNLLSAKPKSGAQPTYYESLGYVLTGGVLTAEAVVGQNVVGPVAITYAGEAETLGLTLSKTVIYKDGAQISASAIGVGDVVYYNKKAGIMWVYTERVTGSATTVNYSAQSAVSVMVDGKLYSLTTSAAQKAFAEGGATVGQVVTLTLDREGNAGYAALAFKGPIVYGTGGSLSTLGAGNDATVYRNDKLVAAADLAAYDLVYYDAAKNVVWAYDKKASGTLEAIQPNRMSPTAVVIGGVTYTLSGDKAKQKFGAGGFSVGEMITLLLDYDGNVYDAYTSKQVYGQVQGVVVAYGVKQFPEADGKSSASYYAKVLTSSGDDMEVRLGSSAESYHCRAVRVDFSKSPVAVGGLSSTGVPASGKFNWDARTLGTAALSKDLSVLEVDGRGRYGPADPDRLDGVTIKQGKALLAEKNTAGEITRLILRDVTGDFCGYGVVTSVVENGGSGSLNVSSVYGYNIAGTPGVLQLSNAIWRVVGGPSVFVFENDAITSIKPLAETEGTVSAVNPLYVKTTTGKTYEVSAGVVVYKYMSGTYVTTNIDDAAACKTVRAYYDKPEDEGGCVRVIIGY